jgi:hypothetical protein
MTARGAGDCGVTVISLPFISPRLPAALNLGMTSGDGSGGFLLSFNFQVCPDF